MADLILDPPLNGVSKVLVRDSQTLGRGGEATVYPAEIGGRVFAAKIFHDPKNINLQKIIAMLVNSPAKMEHQIAGVNYPMYSWPIGILYDTNKHPLGFLMPLIDLKQSFTLDYYYDRGLIGSLNSVNEFALSYRIEIAMHLSEMVADLHAHQNYFVDIKPQNVRVFKTTHAVTLIDCDGFSIFDPRSNTRFPATMYSSDYIAPEVLKANLPATKLGEEQDLYGLATIIFQLFNWGIHPFQGIVQPGIGEFDTNDDKAKAFLYPHGLIAHPQIKPRPQSVHACFDDVTRQMFDQAFIGPANARPKAQQWAEHLRNLYESKGLAKCTTHPNDIKHMRWAGKDCPQCLIDKMSKSNLQPKAQPISMPKPVSSLSAPYVSTSQTTSTASTSGSPAPKKTNKWLLGLFSGVAVVIMKVIAINAGSSINLFGPTTYYTSFYINPYTRTYSVTSNTTSYQQADLEVAAMCGTGCKKVPVPDGKCISVAFHNNGAYSAGVGDTLEAARSNALQNCNNSYKNCHIPGKNGGTDASMCAK
jgi:serine/threonine protein kinase